MKTKFIILIITLCLSVLFVGGAYGADYHINGPTNAEAVSQLQSIGTSHLGDDIYLDMDVDLSGVSWTPIGSSTSNYFYGNFYGQGHTISNLEVTSSGSAGFFNYFSGTLTKLNVVSATLSGSSRVGFVANFMSGTISECNFYECSSTTSNILCGICFGGGASESTTLITTSNIVVSDSIVSALRLGGGIGGSLEGHVSVLYNCYCINNQISCSSDDTSNSATGGIIGYVGTNPQITNYEKCVVLSSSLTGKNTGRISGTRAYVTTNINNNYAGSTVTLNGAVPTSNIGLSTYNGQTISPGTSSGQYNNRYFWQTTLGWDFTNTWYWDYNAQLPKLRAFAEAPSFTTPTGSATILSGASMSSFSTTYTNPSGLLINYKIQKSTDETTWTNAAAGAVFDSSGTITFSTLNAPTISTAAQPYYLRVVWDSDYSSTEYSTSAFSTIVYNTPAQPTTLAISSSTATEVQSVYPTGTSLTLDVDDAQYSNRYRFYYRASGSSSSGEYISMSESSSLTTSTFNTVGTYQIGVTTMNVYTSGGTSTTLAESAMKWFDTPLLDVYNPPTITTDISASPNNPYVKTATNIVLSVTATDSGSSKQATQYEWYEQPYGTSTWDLLATTTTNTYTMSGKTYQNTHPYKYKVIVKGYGGSATSSEISVTPQNYAAPTISSASIASPTSSTVYVNTYYTLSLAATVTDPGTVVQATTYQWYVQTPSSSTFTAITDGNVKDYSASNYVFDTAGTYKYHLVATGQGGSTTSSDLSLVVSQYAAPTISSVSKQAPAVDSEDVGTQFQLLIVASVTDPGSASITGTSIQWYRQYNSGTWDAITGATSSTLNIQENYAASGTYKYKIVVTGQGGTVDSSTLSTPLVITMTAISVVPSPEFTSLVVTPSASPLYPSQSFSVSASATNASTYVWYYRLSTGSTWTQFLATASGTYALNTAGTYQIKCIATGEGGATDSSTVSGLERFITVSAWPLPVIQSFTVTPSATPLIAGGSITVSSQTQNTQSVVYDYRLNTTQSWTVIVGTTQTFTTAGTYYVRCTASNGHGDTTSQTATVVVNPARVPILTVSISPTSGEIISSTGTTFVINLEASENDPDDTITYRQWQILSPAAGATWQDTGIINPRGSYRLDTTQSGIYYFKYVTSGVYDVSSSEKAFNVTASQWIRAMATATVSPVSTQPVNSLIDSMDVTPGTYFDPIEVFEQLLWPYTQGDDLLNSLILLCIFVVPILMVWLITKNILIPSIIGLIFGVWLLTFIPAGYYGVSVALIALSIVGGIIRIFKPPQ